MGIFLLVRNLSRYRSAMAATPDADRDDEADWRPATTILRGPIPEEQRAWLMAIRDHLSVNIEIRPEDMMDAPEFSGRGGIVKARALFGARLPALLDELNEVLVA